MKLHNRSNEQRILMNKDWKIPSLFIKKLEEEGLSLEEVRLNMLNQGYGKGWIDYYLLLIHVAIYPPRRKTWKR